MRNGCPPYQDCIIAAKQPSPHYTVQGCEYLSERIIGLIVDLAQGLGANTRSNENFTLAEQGNPRLGTKTKSLVRICNHLVFRLRIRNRREKWWRKFLNFEYTLALHVRRMKMAGDISIYSIRALKKPACHELYLWVKVYESISFNVKNVH